MPAELPLLVLLSCLLLFPTCPDRLEGQYFGRNKVQYDDFDFRVLPTDHFRIHFYAEMVPAAGDLARMSERWYERLARTFQHAFDESKPLIFYADHPDFQQTNTLRGFIGEGTGGVTESLKNRVIMPLTGSYAETDHVLGHELVHAFQYDLAQSRSGGGVQSLARLPLWLVEGMAEYLSVGRDDPLTAMWLRDAIRRDDLPTIEEMSRSRRYFPYRFGQALWAYVGGVYGDETVTRLFRRALRGGWDAAVHSELGISTDTLSAQWRRAVEDHYLPLLEERTPPREAGTRLVSPATGGGSQNLAPSLSPDGRYVAFLSEKDLFSIDLFLADARTGEVIRTLSSAASDAHFDALRFIDSSVTWSPDASRVAFVVVADGDNQLVVVRTEDGEVLERIGVPEVGAIMNPAWSPDGAAIAFTGMRGGISDLYLLEVGDRTVHRLTDDRHADFHPTWSPDGEVLVFVSDRGPGTDFDALHYGPFQLAFLDLETGAVDHFPVFEGARHSNPQFSPDGESLYFLSDQDGFSDIYRLELATGEVFRVTRLATGVSGITEISPAMSVAAETGTLAFSVFDGAEFHIYTLDRQVAGADRRAAADEASGPGGLLPPPSPEVRSRVARYLGDSRTGLPRRDRYDPTEGAEGYDPSLELDYVSQTTLGVGTDRFGTFLAGGASAFFSDMLGDRFLGVAVQAQGTVKDLGGQFFYLNQTDRWNWGLSGGRTPFLLQGVRGGRSPDGGRVFEIFRQRLYVDAFQGRVAYPFSTTRRVETSLGVTRYSFDVEAERFVTDGAGRVVEREKVDVDTFGDQNLASASVALVGDDSFFGFTSPVRGGRYRIEVESTTGTVDFRTLTVDWRRYFHPFRNLTVGIRGLHFGRYGGRALEESEVIQPLFLGFEPFIRGYALESFEPGAECTRGVVPGDDCPEFTRLFGHRIAVTNFELRVPFLGTERFGLVSFPYLPTELVAFADAGMAWSCGGGRFCGGSGLGDDPVLRLDRNTFQRVPVVSTGLSARFNLAGVLILEVYYAYPFHRPHKGWHGGFQIAPGW